MFGLNRLNRVDDMFDFQREFDRLFNQFWTDLPTRTAASPAASFHVTSTEDAWRIDVPLPGVDPAHVDIEVSGNTLSIRANEPGGDKDGRGIRYEQTLSVPQFLDLEKISASHRHGMLQLTLPLKESVKPRRVRIETVADDQKQLTSA